MRSTILSLPCPPVGFLARCWRSSPGGIGAQQLVAKRAASYNPLHSLLGNTRDKVGAAVLLRDGGPLHRPGTSASARTCLTRMYPWARKAER